jgi:protein TonB
MGTRQTLCYTTNEQLISDMFARDEMSAASSETVTVCIETVGRKSAQSRYLLTALGSSGIAHAAAAWLVSSLLGGYFIQLFPPPNGLSSIQLTASPMLVVEASVEEDTSESPPVTLLAGEPIARSEPDIVLRARAIPISPQGRLPPMAIDETKFTSPEDPSTANLRLGLQPAERQPQRILPPPPVTAVAPPLKQHIARTEPILTPVPPSDQVSRPSVASAQTPGAESDVPQRKLYSPEPEYPADALAARQTGRVVLRVKVDTDGRVTSVSIYRSSNVPSLDQAALTAVRQWRFTPALRNNIPIRTEIAVPIRFEIEN